MSRQASGLKAWLVQRVSAVYLMVFSVLLAIELLVDPPADYLAWREWVGRPWVNLGLLLFVPMLLAHAWVGVRDVLLDYVRPFRLRVLLLTLLALVLLTCGLWALRALILVGLDGS